jgi:hypothetical protein
MKSTTKALALGLLLLATTSALQAQTTRGASATVRVSMDGDELRVSTETLVLPAGVSTITWQISHDSWRFAPGSIDFGAAAGGFNCRVFNDGAAISCNRNSSAPQGRLPYRIRLTDGGPMVVPPQPNIYISLE